MFGLELEQRRRRYVVAVNGTPSAYAADAEPVTPACCGGPGRPRKPACPGSPANWRALALASADQVRQVT
jgi:hypothetical protein